MRRSWIAALLAFFTLVGGHFYNRRPYKAFLVLFLFLLVSKAASILLPLLLPTDAAAFPALMRRFALPQAIIVGGFMLASAAIAFVDARKAGEPESPELVLAAGALASAYCALLITIAAFSLYSALFLLAP